MNQYEYQSLQKILTKIIIQDNPFQKEVLRVSNNYSYPKDDNYFEENIIRCPICLGNVMTPVRPKECSHIFCLLCFLKWTELSSKCPYCKKEFSTYIKLTENEFLKCCQCSIYC